MKFFWPFLGISTIWVGSYVLSNFPWSHWVHFPTFATCTIVFTGCLYLSISEWLK